MKNLYIDTSNNKEVAVALQIETEKDTVTKEVGREKAQVVLPMIVDILKKHNLTLFDLENIYVVEGPGSFTGLRVGVAIANTLGILLQIPINDNIAGKAVEPIYS